MTITYAPLYSLGFDRMRTYFYAVLFIAGNIILPQAVHMLPDGGVTWLPIYFFTLIGAYKYGWRVGLLTALLSPVINCTVFGMPATEVLMPVMLKSVLLAVTAGVAASRFGKASLPALITVVACYQLLGTLGEWCLSGDFYVAVQDFRIGLPGMLLQVFGGWVVINGLKKY